MTDGISVACNAGQHYDCLRCPRCACHERPSTRRDDLHLRKAEEPS